MMKNSTKTLNKFTAILIMTLFLGSMFYFNPENTLTDILEESQVTEQIPDTKVLDDSFVKVPTRSVIDYNTWYEGETIKIDSSLPSSFPDMTSWTKWTISANTLTYTSGSFIDVFADDISWLRYDADYNDMFGSYFEFYIDTPISNSTFQYVIGIKKLKSSTEWVEYSDDVVFENTGSITFVRIRLESNWIYGSQYDQALNIKYTDRDGIIQTAVDIYDDTFSDGATGYKSAVYFDLLRIIPVSITEHIRTHYKYTTATTLIHEVKSIVYYSSTTMTIFKPENWNYLSVSPVVEVLDSSNVICNALPLGTYIFHFASSCNNFLAIEDVSHQYFTDIGFEGGTTDTYINLVTNPFETFETSTEQSFAGYSSLKTVQNAGTDGIAYVALPNDYYYVDCWAYIASITGGAETVSITWWNGTAWNYEYFDPAIIDRWQNLQFYMQIIDDDSGRNFQFYVSATTATVYFDYESILFQTSTTIQTTQSSEYEISSTLISWDGYKNPLLEGQQTLNTTILERSSQTVEYTTNLTSTTGIFELLYDQALEQKEYEIWTYSYSSGEFNNCSFYFTPSESTHTDYAETELLDAWDFTEGDKEGWTPYSSVSDVVENGYWEKDSTTAYSKYYIQNIEAFDETYYTLIEFQIWSNVSQTISFLQKTGGLWGTVRRQTNHALIADTWTIITVVGITTYDIDCFIINTDVNTNSKKVRLDYVVLVHVDSPVLIETDTTFYLSSTNNDYSYEIYSDETYLGVYTDLQTILKNNTVGNHNLTYVLFSAGEETAYLSSSYEYLYTVSAASFTVYLESFYLSYLYVNTFVTSNYDGTYIVYEDGTPEDSGTLYKDGTTIITSRDVTPGASINYTIAFTYGSEMVAFQTYYNNPNSDFFVTSYSVDIDTTITITWGTSKSSTDSLTVLENGVEKVTDDPASTTTWTKATAEGTYIVTLIFEATDYTDILYSFSYTVAGIESFSVSVESFYLSDTYVNAYVTSNYDGDYYVYQDNTPDGSGSLSAIGTTISSARDTTAGATIEYAIKFVNGSTVIWFNTTYSNVFEAFAVESYFIDLSSTITITWDTTKDSTDSLTVYEDDVLKVNADLTSTSSWSKSSVVGEHYVTLIFSATNFLDIIYSFTYTVAATEDFQVNIESFYVSDDFLNIYCTSNYDYSYEAYTNNSLSGSGSGLSVGTFIIIPKQTTAGIFNLTVAFVNGSETVLFMTWYSNLLLPPTPINDIYRAESEGYYNISFMTNLDTFWIDIYHDNVLIYDDSTLTDFSILKDTLVGWHNVSLVLIYNCSTDAEGYPVPEYNQTVTYPVFYYETVLFYDCQIRYTERIYGIAIPEITVDSVLTYLDGVLVDTLNYTSVIQDHSNYSYILNNRLWIHNSARTHRLVVRDLFDNLIYNTTIDIGIIHSMTIELPLEKLYIINLDDEDRLIKIRPYLSGLDWDADSDDLITMILGQYEVKSYWLIDATYESRIFKKYANVTDGVTLWYWVHDPIAPPPERVPFSITIPLVTDDDDDSDDTWWDKVVNFFKQYWFYIAAVLLLIIVVIAYNAIGNAIVKKQEKKLKQNKKVGLMVQTVLQLLWATKYERLKGYERGKQK